ncbi:CHC2 zinc finger domain-containing protein [Mucilaginibacter roseus]|uniref:CHC2 zinc finger domain-containing protein n=1 Tax=Mucilaginibacter roseus TaxID=1528868 RepID=A0ABS8U7S1_9SPHI|nr:CHC2 zinc finger domain-containing protein [Mucilaginibacter roseus]MCD8742200.1 CHC2 zinc finger domain-containing protein [Mucilaginibacter roseus]
MPSDELISHIQTKAPIVNIVSAYLPLQDSRKALKGRCPFHPDSGASLMVSQDKNTFKCFGCGKEGGPIEFLMAVEGKSRSEVAGRLAVKLGLVHDLRAV